MNKTTLEKIADQIEGEEKAKEEMESTSGNGETPDRGSSSPQAPEASEVATKPVDTAMVIEFFQTNPNPNDEAYHQFAEEQGWDVHEAESIAYRLATKFVNLLKGGLMNTTEGFDLNAVDPNQLEMGIKVEMEHTPDQTVAKKIALDHLAEIPDYYTRLDKMEKEAEQSANAAAAPEDKESGEDEEEGENGENGQDQSMLFKQSAYDRGATDELKKLAACGAMHRISAKKKRKPTAKYR